jgi:hypothetical protein
MTGTILATLACFLALAPALVYHRNLRLYRPPEGFKAGFDRMPSAVSVLIPARNEEHTIGAAVKAALRSVRIDVEVIVLDDHSTDRTAQVVRDLAARDWRVRLIPAPPLPPGWCGKQHACAVLATLAAHPLLAFIDADVQLGPYGLARLARFLETSHADLVSGIPYQRTGTCAERLVIPLIHFLLLGFLPLWRMRRSNHPAYAAGCGQLFLARREAYERVGGHAAIRASLHDGLTLPRVFRKAGLRTDLCDATELASCRMYRTASEVWHGLGKNATEGLASAAMIVPATGLLLGGQVLPVVLLCLGLVGGLSPLALVLAGIGTVATYYPRWRSVRRFGQSRFAALLHPCGILVLLAIQWYARMRVVCGRPVTWKERSYTAKSSTRAAGRNDGCSSARIASSAGN